MRKTRAIRAENVQKWADKVKPEDLTDTDPEVTNEILEALGGDTDVNEEISTTS